VQPPTPGTVVGEGDDRRLVLDGATDPAVLAPATADVWMNHPESKGHARTSRRAFETVWKGKGWVESSAEAVRLTEETGEFVREAPAGSGPDQEATSLGAADAARGDADATVPVHAAESSLPSDAPSGGEEVEQPQG